MNFIDLFGTEGLLPDKLYPKEFASILVIDENTGVVRINNVWRLQCPCGSDLVYSNGGREFTVDQATTEFVCFSPDSQSSPQPSLTFTTLDGLTTQSYNLNNDFECREKVCY